MERPITDRIMQWITRQRMSRLVFYVGCIVIAVLAYLFEQHMQHATNWALGQIPPDPQPGTLNEAEKGQISAFLQMNQLITTLGTTLMGALGFLLANRKKGSPGRGLWAAGASFVCVGLSIYFGYRAYTDIINMLQSARTLGWFDMVSGVIPVERKYHFLFFVLGVFFFADFAFHELNQGGAADAVKD